MMYDQNVWIIVDLVFFVNSFSSIVPDSITLAIWYIVCWILMNLIIVFTSSCLKLSMFNIIISHCSLPYYWRDDTWIYV